MSKSFPTKKPAPQQQSTVANPIHYMLAQVPFNQEDLAAINAPRAALMDDVTNLKLIQRNLSELNVLPAMLRSSATTLEIGCGRGYVLDHLYNKGTGLYLGIEPLASEAKVAQKRLATKNLPAPATWQALVKKPRASKVPVWHTTLEKLTIQHASLTHIYSYHVIEHVENPLFLIQASQKWLKPGGNLIIICPNVESVMAEKYFFTWRCNLHCHRWLPGITTLTRMVTATGFTVKKVFSYGGHPHPRAWWQSMANHYYKWQNKGDVLCLLAQKLP